MNSDEMKKTFESIDEILGPMLEKLQPIISEAKSEKEVVTMIAAFAAIIGGCPYINSPGVKQYIYTIIETYARKIN